MTEVSKTAYLVSWNVEGLQCLFNATMWQKKQMWAILAERDYPTGPNLMELIVRASRNPELEYEIYSFEADEGLTEEMIKVAFDTNPQEITNLIRKQGDKLYNLCNDIRPSRVSE